MIRKTIQISAIVLVAVTIMACSGLKKNTFKYHFADKDEAVKRYLANEEYFADMSISDIQYRTQDKNGTVEELKAFGTAQMQEFTDEEKTAITNTLKEMESELKSGGYRLPPMGEIVFIKSTQLEEGDSGAYTHGTHIYLGQYLIDMICSEDEIDRKFGKETLWHEIFHCLTRNDPEFRKDMYGMIHFTVQDKEYELPSSVLDRYISNPDVEHHNSYASFDIGGEMIDCYVTLIVSKPFEKEGDSFFDYAETALVPVDGSDTYYLSDDAENFWEVFGENTDYVLDPEECMADNFAFAMTYGEDGMDYSNPEIITQILDYLSSGK